jgi:(E)-4-hydroxy-3-methylbut-2-enyl-diphosphate synthase
MTLRGPTLAKDFEGIVVDYIERRFGKGSRNVARL